MNGASQNRPPIRGNETNEAQIRPAPSAERARARVAPIEPVEPVAPIEPEEPVEDKRFALLEVGEREP